MTKELTIEHLVSDFGTPLYVYDLSEINRRITDLQSMLPLGARIFYSLKANPLPAIVDKVLSLGCGLEVSSEGELMVAMEANGDTDSILFSGPGKIEADLCMAIEAGVHIFSCESFGDLIRVSKIAGRYGVVADVLLRIGPDCELGAGLNMTTSHFGFEEEALTKDALEEALVEKKNVRFIGTHFFLGTQICDCESIRSSFRIANETTQRIKHVLPDHIRVLDFGGGFPWPFANNSPDIKIKTLRKAIQSLFTEMHLKEHTEAWFESGRFIVASSGKLILKVLDIVRKKDRNFVVVDGGINIISGMAATGRVLRPKICIEPFSKQLSKDHEIFDVVGPLCTPLDCIAQNVLLPAPSEGDLVKIENVGAYGLTASPNSFLSRKPPVEICLEGSNLVSAHRLKWGIESVKSREMIL